MLNVNSTESNEQKFIFSKDRTGNERKRRSEPRITPFRNPSLERKEKRDFTMHPNMVFVKSKFANDSVHLLKQNQTRPMELSPTPNKR